MGKDLKKMDENNNPINENENQRLKNKKESGPLKILMDYAGQLLRKHFIDDKNYTSALKLTREILENTSPENKTNVFNMIKNTFDDYESVKNKTIESNLKDNNR